MRISDWSSDVCSSDLLGARLVELSVVDRLDHREQQILFLALMSLKGDRRDHRAGEVALAVFEQLARHEQAIYRIEGGFGIDLFECGDGRTRDRYIRKSVVRGRRMLVRVDFGVTRLLKHKLTHIVLHAPITMLIPHTT